MLEIGYLSCQREKYDVQREGMQHRKGKQDEEGEGETFSGKASSLRHRDIIIKAVCVWPSPCATPPRPETITLSHSRPVDQQSYCLEDIYSMALLIRLSGTLECQRPGSLAFRSCHQGPL
jgi:hypothetical protein